jgi:DNA repair photolyase
MTTYHEVHAKNLINAIPHSKFAVTKGLGCRLSMNTSFGCEKACSYCYIRYLTRWKGMGPNEIFQEVNIRVNAPELLARELRRRQREYMWIGSTADPYQSFEAEYKLMRGCLEVLGEHSFPFEIITKGPLVARDADLLAANPLGMVAMSLFSSLDDQKRKRIELKSEPVADRIEALAALNRAGVSTMALLLPILPNYSDDLSEIAEVLRHVRAAGTTRVYAGMMRLYPITWKGMRQLMPPRVAGLRDQYQEMYFGPGHSISAGAHVPEYGYRRTLMERISLLARELGFAQFSCEENWFDLWFGPQDEHAGFRYAVHYDFYCERQRLGGRPLTLAEALAVAQRFVHTPSFLSSLGRNLDLLNGITTPSAWALEAAHA